MPRQSAIKIKVEIVVPYDRKKFGDTSRAEAEAMKLQRYLHEEVNGIEVAKWSAEHATVEAPEAPAPTRQAAE